MENKDLDQDIFREVVKILRQEREKAYWSQIKSMNKKKKRIKRNVRKKILL